MKNNMRIITTVLFICLACLSATAQKNKQDSDIKGMYDLYNNVEKMLPGGWKIARREEKRGQPYFVIFNDRTYLVPATTPYEGEPHKEEEWAKKTGYRFDYEIHLYFNPSSEETYLQYKQSTAETKNTPTPPTNPTPTPTTTNKNVLNGTLEEVLADIENKYGIKELAFDKDAGTYAAFTKSEKDRLVNYLLAKEYYAGRPQISINLPIGAAPMLFVKNHATKEVYTIEIRHKYSTNDYHIYPKYVTSEAQKIEQFIYNTLK
jgi:hypothetical protein